MLLYCISSSNTLFVLIIQVPLCSLVGPKFSLKHWESLLDIFLKDPENLQIKVLSLSAQCTDRLYSTGNIPGTHFCYWLSRPQSHSMAWRIMSMKNSNDRIWSRTWDLLPFMYKYGYLRTTAHTVVNPTAAKIQPFVPHSKAHFNFLNS